MEVWNKRLFCWSHKTTNIIFGLLYRQHPTSNLYNTRGSWITVHVFKLRLHQCIFSYHSEDSYSTLDSCYFVSCHLFESAGVNNGNETNDTIWINFVILFLKNVKWTVTNILPLIILLLMPMLQNPLVVIGDVTSTLRRFTSPTFRLLVQQLVRANVKNITQSST